MSNEYTREVLPGAPTVMCATRRDNSSLFTLRPKQQNHVSSTVLPNDVFYRSDAIDDNMTVFHEQHSVNSVLLPMNMTQYQHSLPNYEK